MLRKNKLYLDNYYKNECENKINYAKKYLEAPQGEEKALGADNNTYYTNSETGTVELLKTIDTTNKTTRKL